MPDNDAGPDVRRVAYVVDDEGAVRRSLALLLRSVGFSVQAYDSGEAFLRAAEAAAPARGLPFGCVLLDLRMPGMDGLTVIREAKQISASLPIIIITGYSTESSAIEAVNLGVAGYLTKPFRVPQVLAAAAKALGASAA